MPLFSWAMQSVTRFNLSAFPRTRATPSVRLWRANPLTNTWGGRRPNRPSPSCSAMSVRTSGVAVAVNATTWGCPRSRKAHFSRR